MADRALTPLTGSASLQGLAVFALFRGDRTQLLQWANAHVSAGADHVYAVLDRPVPGLVEGLPEHSRVTWMTLGQQTWDQFYVPGGDNVERKQVDVLRVVARRAAADGHGYLAFVDADEVVMLRQPFDVLRARFPDADVLRLGVREVWYADDAGPTAPFAASLALRRPAGRYDWSRALGWRAQFLRAGVLGHDGGKCLYRLPIAPGEVGVHGPVSGHLRERTVDVPADSGDLLHFDAGSVSTWNAKWGSRLDRDTVAFGLGPHRKAQLQLFAHALSGGADTQEAFFRGFFTLTDEARETLDQASLIEPVDLEVAVSGPLPVTSGGGQAGPPSRPPLDGHRVDFQFAMVCDQRFVAPTMATMLSVIAQIGDRGSIRFVILGDGLTPAHAARFREVELTPYDVEVRVHDVTSDLDRDVGTEDAKRATFGRIYLIDHLPPQRTIYLDGDILATRDFTELFRLDLQGACLAGVTDSAALRLDANPAGVPIEQRMRLVGITRGDPSDYLNGGVLIFDLDNPDFQRLALEARSLVVTRGRSLKQRDQDAMNLAFAGRKYRLPNTYNYMTQFYVSDRCVDEGLPAVKYAHADASLIHFSGAVKPWEHSEAEFYNGLYRRLVHEAEERLGVSSGLYFSLPARSPREAWSPQRWADVLGAPDRPSPDAERTPDLELVDITADGVYVRISTDLLRLARRQDLVLRIESRGQELATLPLSALSPPLVRLVASTRPGVRRLPLDLEALLAGTDGIARDVELTLAAPQALDGFSRWVAGSRLLAAPSAATAGLIEEIGIRAAVTGLADGMLSGWCDVDTLGQRPRLSMHVAGELVARLRLEPSLDDQRAMFSVPVADLVGRGYPSDAPLTVRIPATNVPVPGPRVTIGMLGEPASTRSAPSTEADTGRGRPRTRWRRGREAQ